MRNYSSKFASFGFWESGSLRSLSERLASASLFHICLDANEVSIGEPRFFQSELAGFGEM